MRHAGRERNSEEVRQRTLTQWTRWDPLAQFSERSEMIFQEAVHRDMDELAEQFGGLSLTPTPSTFLIIGADGNINEVEEVD